VNTWHYGYSNGIFIILKHRLHLQRSKYLSNLISADVDLCYCNNIPWLFEIIEINYNQVYWRPWVDSSQEVAKIVLFGNKNTLPTVLVVCSTTRILNKRICNTNRWHCTFALIWKYTSQALALQPAVWGISCLVLPSSCNASNLHPSFSNNNKVTAVTHTKRINRNLFAH